MSAPHFVDDRHALYTGWILGLAMKNGLVAQPIVDSEGNYTDRIVVELFDPRQRPVNILITFIVPPPPNDWDPSDEPSR